MSDVPTFGRLLSRYRRRAHLTQQDLAERAGYSSHYVSMLERGVRRPQPLTVDVFADVLTLQEPDRAEFHAVAERVPRPAGTAVAVSPRPLFGREQDITRVSYLLQHGDGRLLTLTGPGGVGKTCLAVSVAAALSPAFADGTTFVDLSVTTDSASVLPAMTRTLGLRELGGRPIGERLVAFLRAREMLLVLDSFERVLDAAPALGDLLRVCPQVKLLITSRIPLRLQIEQEYRVPPLVLPEPGAAHALLESPALALFGQRATLVDPGFVIDDVRAPVVADICRRLDGLPLAIELAAVQVAHLPLTTLRDRLEHRLRILTGGARDLPARQQRMRDTIAWSYDLLTPPEQVLFRQLSVFARSWSLEAAEAVCIGRDPNDDVLDSLRALVQSSLVIPSDGVADEPRYRMLDTIQEFAVEQLAEAAEVEVIRRRHAEYYVRLAEQAEPALQGRDQQVWHPRLEREQDNIGAALAWLLAANEAELALRLAGAVWRFWQHHGDVREGRRWLDESLTKGNCVQGHVRAKALWAASWLAYYHGDYARSKALSAEHLTLAREQDDALGVRNALTGLGMAAMAEGSWADALSPLQESLDICRDLGKSWHLATSHLNLGVATMLAGDDMRALALFEEALALYQERGDDVFTARALQHLGYIALLQADYDRASTLFERSLQALFDLGDKMGIADGLEGVAASRAAVGRTRDAAQLLGAATALREGIGISPFPSLRRVWRPYTIGAEEALGEAAWLAGQAEGRAMSLRDAVALAQLPN